MSVLKAVLVENGEIAAIIEDADIPTDLPNGVTIEQREMEYTSLHGWREVGWQPPVTLEEQLAEKDRQILLLKAQNQTLVDRTDFHEEVLAEIILTIAP